MFCQLEALRHCLPSSLRRIFEELPETLDETYERVLRDINKANRGPARRLLQCLAVALRPLRVEGLAEVLAMDFDAPAHGGIPQLNPNWRLADHHQAIMSTCSSLITIVDDGHTKWCSSLILRSKNSLPQIGWLLQAKMSPTITSFSSLHTQFSLRLA